MWRIKVFLGTMHTMSGEPQKAHLDTENADSPSNSELVLDLVMPYLPTKDCVRTSILSSRWRYRWTTIPSLVSDTACCPSSFIFTMEEEGRVLANIVNHVLSLHNGSIQVFKFRGPCVAPDIDRWILRVSRDSIKTLVLELRGAVEYKLPSSLFSCGSLSSLKLKKCLLMPPPSSFKGFKNLKCLELVCVALTKDAFEKLISSCPLLEKLVLNLLERWRTVRYQFPSSPFTCSGLGSLELSSCLLRPPSSFKGFKNLKCLELECFTLTNDAFEKLISYCPLLEKLAIDDLKGAVNLKTNAPNLQSIHIYGDFASITFGYAMTRLSEIHIDAPRCACDSLLDFFVKLPSIQRLELGCCFMGYMDGGHALGGFPFECKDLYHLAISMDFSLTRRGVATLYLYRRSSNLTRQQMEAWDDCYLAIELGVWEDTSNCHNKFEKLRSVNVDSFRGSGDELEFVEFALGHSPVLEKMRVNPRSDYITRKAIRSIYGFKRASTKAEILFDGRVIPL